MAIRLPLILQESPQWLVYHDHHMEAQEVLVRPHGYLEEDADAQVQFQGVPDALEHEKEEGKSLEY